MSRARTLAGILSGAGITGTLSATSLTSNGTISSAAVSANTVSGAGQLTSLTVTSVANVQSKMLATSYSETTANVAQGNTINCQLGNFFEARPNNNVVYNFTNPPPTGQAFGFGLKISANATVTIGWPASVNWAGGTAPDATANTETDVFTFVTHDGGTNWYGFQSGDALA